MKTVKLIDGKIQIIEHEKPKIFNNGAIIKVLGCGLCGSDLVKIKHATKENERQIVLGHEVVGIIDEINCDVKGYKKGDIVALGHHYPCFQCEFCKNGSYSMCQTFKESNIFPAGFSEYIKINENHLKYTVYKMSNELKHDEMAFLEPLACCVRAIRRAGFDYYQNNSRFSALVVGLGSIGTLFLKALRAFRVDVEGFDINPDRQEFAKSQGFIFDENRKFDTVFLTAGSSKAIQTALDKVVDGGKIIVFASVEDDLKGFMNNEIYYRELSVIASYSPSPYDIELSSMLLNNKKVNMEGLSTHYSLDNLIQAIDDSFNNKVFKAYIKI